MQSVFEALLQRKKELESLKEHLEKQLKAAPAGSLRVNCARHRTQYYHRRTPSERNGVYIPKKKKTLAEALAQKEYTRKLLASVRKELDAIEAYFAGLPPIAPEEVYKKLSDARKGLIVPSVISDEMFVEEWEKVSYVGNPFPMENADLVTDRGECVRSKSELIIANTLAAYQIPYRYECPIMLQGFGTYYPDFTVLNKKLRKEIYWEHLGMMDNPDYAESAVQKITQYNKSDIYPGDNLILTFETRSNPISTRQIKSIITKNLLQ